MIYNTRSNQESIEDDGNPKKSVVYNWYDTVAWPFIKECASQLE